MTRLLVLLLFFSAGLLATLAPSQTAVACVNLIPGPEGRGCTFSSQCRGNLVCHRSVCVHPSRVQNDDQWEEPTPRARPAPPRTPVPAPEPQPVVEELGADDACGYDRRCRIDRLRHRNRHRRHLEIAEQERMVYGEVERTLARRVEEIPRLDKPWMVGFYYFPRGPGLMGSRTLAAHLRLDLALAFDFSWIYHIPDDPTIPAVDGDHDVTYGLLSGTYLLSRRWFSPYLSAGIGYGRGSFGSGFSRNGSGVGNPQLVYHFASAAVGAEAQVDSGFAMRLGFRHGFVFYNQARYGPGSYDSSTRRGLRDYMNSRGMMGVDFMIGWAF